MYFDNFETEPFNFKDNFFEVSIASYPPIPKEYGQFKAFHRKYCNPEEKSPAECLQDP